MRGKPLRHESAYPIPRIIPARAGQTWKCPCSRTSRQDHPRACGANSFYGEGPNIGAGSSPRVRGKLAVVLVQVRRVRIIPARAGQTSTSPLNGEAGDGSSPRVRGKRAIVLTSCLSCRIIPARAGQTGPVPSVICLGTDHPRACGANSASDWVEAWRTGSSLRVRGKRLDIRRGQFRERIIPARAGQTCRAWIRPWSRPDHPRACGANEQEWVGAPERCGSSPRVRGKPALVIVMMHPPRIIPARAGQTSTRGVPSTSTSDHPRACGANGWPRHNIKAQNGSSPRVRGKQHQWPKPCSPLRIIPARAGQTPSVHVVVWAPADHPRACGANDS
mgnify:CR=1 FL=1